VIGVIIVMTTTVLAISSPRVADRGGRALAQGRQEKMQEQPGSLAGPSSVTYTQYLPLTASDYCSDYPSVSPFSLQIAALHQVQEPEGGGQSLEPMTQAEWLAAYDEAFPTLMEALEESGAGWSRVRIDWSLIQPDPPPAGYVWDPYHDPKLRLVAETGVQLIATVADAPDWAADASCAPIYTDQLDEFGQFLTDLVNHYKQPPYNIHHWELFNEPDGTYNNPEVDPSESGLGCWGYDGDRYAQMAGVAYQAIKAADSTATVLMGGVAYDWFTEYGGPFYRYFPDDVMQAGGGDYLDALSFHYFPDFRGEWERWVPHGDPPTCGIVNDGIGTPYEAWGIDLITKSNHFRNRMSTCHGVNKPLWVTELAEHGYANDPNSLGQQARYVIKGHACGLAAGVENITWYALTTPNDEFGQGLLYDDWTPKPAYYAYQTLTSQLDGYWYHRTRVVPNGEAYVFRGPCRVEKTVAWGSGTLTFSAPEGVRVVDRDGNETSIDDGGVGDEDGSQNGVVELLLSDDPVFVWVLED
jgi:hypothetical protein